MNIVTTLLDRLIEGRLNDKGEVNKGYPCKAYLTLEKADKATAKAAANVGRHLDREAKPANYLVLYVKEWDMYVGCIDMTEVLRRPSGMGGYLGVEPGFFKY